MDPVAQRYPKSLQVDFRKLERSALMKVLAHYDVNPKVGATQAELACTVARIFESSTSSPDSIIFEKFSSRFGSSSNIPQSPLSGSKRMKAKSSRDAHEIEPAKVGEQVAAKVIDSDENGSWILGNVTEYSSSTGTYIIQDEDDASRIITLSSEEVRRLDDNASHLRKDDLVLAVFPDTTSFYRAIIAKNPRPIQQGSTPQWDVIVRFEDDEDDSGKAPPRRVPARFVLTRTDLDPVIKSPSALVKSAGVKVDLKGKQSEGK